MSHNIFYVKLSTSNVSLCDFIGLCIEREFTYLQTGLKVLHKESVVESLATQKAADEKYESQKSTTYLNDSKPSSFREALNDLEPRALEAYQAFYALAQERKAEFYPNHAESIYIKLADYEPIDQDLLISLSEGLNRYHKVNDIVKAYKAEVNKQTSNKLPEPNSNPELTLMIDHLKKNPNLYAEKLKEFQAEMDPLVFGMMSEIAKIHAIAENMITETV